MASVEEITALYQKELGRNPDSTGMATWTGMSTEDALAGIRGSQEYQGNQVRKVYNEDPGRVDEVARGVETAYQTAFGRSATQEEMTQGVGANIDNDSWDSVFNQMMHGFKNAGKIDDYKDPHIGEKGMLGGYGAIVGGVVGGIVGFFASGFNPLGAMAGASLGAGAIGGAETYETNHELGDYAETMAWSVAAAAVAGAPVASAAVMGIQAKTRGGGDWGDAAMAGGVAFAGAAVGSAGLSGMSEGAAAAVRIGGMTAVGAGGNYLYTHDFTKAAVAGAASGATSFAGSRYGGTGLAVAGLVSGVIKSEMAETWEQGRFELAGGVSNAFSGFMSGGGLGATAGIPAKDYLPSPGDVWSGIKKTGTQAYRLPMAPESWVPESIYSRNVVPGGGSSWFNRDAPRYVRDRGVGYSDFKYGKRTGSINVSSEIPDYLLLPEVSSERIRRDPIVSMYNPMTGKRGLYDERSPIAAQDNWWDMVLRQTPKEVEDAKWHKQFRNAKKSDIFRTA